MKKKEILLVDGYNIIHAWDELKALIDDSLFIARDRLIEILSDYKGFNDIDIIIVFDAHKVKGNIGDFQKVSNVYVAYTKHLQTADSYIERFTLKNSKNYTVKVATSDVLEQVIILGYGAQRISAKSLYNIVCESKKKLNDNYLNIKQVKKNTLFDNLNQETQEILNMYRKKK